MARSRKNLNVKTLRKSNDRYKDTQTGLEFTKKGNNYNMVINKQAQKEHQANVKRLKSLSKKHGSYFNKELRQEMENWENYKKSINDFNTGKTSRPTTVKRRLNEFTNESKNRKKLFDKPSRIAAFVEDKKKVEIMRKTGKHGIYNGKAYDDFLDMVASRFKTKSKQEIEDVLFPFKDDTTIPDSDQIRNIIDSGLKTIEDLIEDESKSGNLSEAEEIELRNLTMVGE